MSVVVGIVMGPRTGILVGINAGASVNVNPVAEFSHIVTGLSVAFTDASTDADGTIASRDWDWGDGTAHGTTQNPTHAYTTAGAKTVRLTVTDNDGGTHFVEHTVTPVPVAPTYQAAGTVVQGAAAQTVVWPTHQAGDIGLLFVETAGTEGATLSTANGFALLTSQDTGVDVATGTKLSIFWCRATGSSMGSPVIADSGDHQCGVIHTFRGCAATGDPWNVFAGNTQTTASTAVSIPGATTTVPNCLVVAAATSAHDIATAQFSSWANADLASADERQDSGGAGGNGGVIGFATGIKATAGAYGATTATLANAALQARISLALKGIGAEA